MRIPPRPPNPSDTLESEHLESYLANELDEVGRRQVEHALKHDAQLRSSFVVQSQMDHALRALLAPDAASFNESVIARLRSEGAGERSFAKSVLLEIVEEREGKRPIRWPDLVKTGLISAAASVGLLLLLQSIVYHRAPARPSSPAADTPADVFLARIERSDAAVWSAESAPRIRKDGWVSAGLLRLESGSAWITFNSGASALVEGPAEFSIETWNRLFLKSGQLAAEVPERASGFTVNTPRLNAVDIGTRFGVSVDGEGNSELHVMQGEVEVSRTSGNTVPTRLREGLAVRADNRDRTQLTLVDYAGDRFRILIGSKGYERPDLRFDFDESGGSILEDSGRLDGVDVPLVATGELDRSPRRSVGKTGGGLVVAPGETLDIPLTSDFRVDAPHTLGLWVKLSASLGEQHEETILTYGKGEDAWVLGCNLDPSRGQKGGLLLKCGEGILVGSTDLADGNWHHIAYRYLGGEDLVSHIHLFVDGKIETPSLVIPGDMPQGSATGIRIGAGRSDQGFEGWLDSLNLFHEGVSTPTIQGLAD